MRDELGDVLLQVVFHAQMAADDGRWDVDDVAEGLVEKLIYRHPHVFGEVEVTGADEVLVNWEKLKAAEAGEREPDVDDDIPASLPSLARAAKVQRRAAGWGFEWRSVDSAVGALREEVDELAAADGPADAEEEVGDVLFATVALARKLGVDAESALRRTVRRILRAVRAVRRARRRARTRRRDGRRGRAAVAVPRGARGVERRRRPRADAATTSLAARVAHRRRTCGGRPCSTRGRARSASTRRSR